MKKIAYALLMMLFTFSCDDESLDYFSIRGSWLPLQEINRGCNIDDDNVTKIYDHPGFYQDTIYIMRFRHDHVIFLIRTDQEMVSITEYDYTVSPRSAFGGTVVIHKDDEPLFYDYHLEGKNLRLRQQMDGSTGCFFEGVYRRGSWDNIR